MILEIIEQSKCGITESKEGALSGDRSFLVRCDAFTAPGLILNAKGIPGRTDSFPGFARLKVDNRSIKPADDFNYTVTVSYKSPTAEESEKEKEDEKLERYPWDRGAYDVSSGSQARTEIAEKAFDDVAGAPAATARTKPILTAAQGKYENPVEIDVYDCIFSFSYDTKESHGDIADYIGTMNNDLIRAAGRSIPQFCGILKDITEKAMVYTDKEGEEIEYFSKSIKILIAQQPVKTSLLEADFCYLNDKGVRTRFVVKDPKGKEIPDPTARLLSSTGEKLKKDADPVYTEYRVIASKAWGKLNMPTERDPKK